MTEGGNMSDSRNDNNGKNEKNHLYKKAKKYLIDGYDRGMIGD